MATLTDLYAKVRNQTDTLPTELPDALINDYLHEAFNRTIAAEVIWPFYETTWNLTLPAGEDSITLPGDVNEPGIVALWDPVLGFRLNLVKDEQALDQVWRLWFTNQYGPWVYTLWAGAIRLHPAPSFDEDREYQLLGYRLPKVWSSLGPNDTPDCDERFHLPLAHYATALAYAREEGTELEDQYMQRWQRDVEMIRQQIMQPNRHRPLRMGVAYHHGIGV